MFQALTALLLFFSLSWRKQVVLVTLMLFLLACLIWA